MAEEEECSRGSAALREMVVGGQGAAPPPGLRPTLADATAAGDLGFTAGEWTGNTAGVQSQGSYVTLWQRAARCSWEVVREARIEHAAVGDASPGDPPRRARLDVDRLSLPDRVPPPRPLVSADALGQAMKEFTATVTEEGLAAGLRTYGRNNDFMLYLDGEAPFPGVDAANSHLVAHPVTANPTQSAARRSGDSSMAFSWGRFVTERTSASGYLQVWQYDPKVANWGLRLLIVTRMTP